MFISNLTNSKSTITSVKNGRPGYGSAPATTSVYNFDPSLGCDNMVFQPCSPHTLSSLKVIGDRFKNFPLSRNFMDKQPPYYGFFMEDQFIGGCVSLCAVNRFISPAQTHPVSQPQFFAPFNSAKQLYGAPMRWGRTGYTDATPVAGKGQHSQASILFYYGATRLKSPQEPLCCGPV
jgi:glucoamylase